MASLLAPLNDWDGVCVWGIKAKVLFYDTVKTSDYFYNQSTHSPIPIILYSGHSCTPGCARFWETGTIWAC